MKSDRQLTYIDLSEDEFWRLRRFDNKLPKARKGVRWRKRLKDSWLIGSYVRDNKKEPFRIEWTVADLSGEVQRILDKSW
jgi:hypothetical protein